MKNYLLIPNRYKMIGWVTLIFFFTVFIFCYQIYPNFINPENDSLQFSSLNWSYNGWAQNVQQEVFTSFIIIGLILIAFAKEKDEDEYISLLRLKSWNWAVLISYTILLLANITLYGRNFFAFMTYNLLMIPVVFIIKFNLSLWMLRKQQLADEK